MKPDNVFFLKTGNKKLITDYLKTFTRYDPLFVKLFEEKKKKRPRNIIVIEADKKK